MGPWSLVGSKMLGRFVVKTREIATLGSPGWGLSDGLMTHPRQKKYTITETRDTFQDSSLAEKCGAFTRNGARIGEVV